MLRRIVWNTSLPLRARLRTVVTTSLSFSTSAVAVLPSRSWVWLPSNWYTSAGNPPY
jgi:hypothetical protein